MYAPHNTLTVTHILCRHFFFNIFNSSTPPQCTAVGLDQIRLHHGRVQRNKMWVALHVFWQDIIKLARHDHINKTMQDEIRIGHGSTKNKRTTTGTGNACFKKCHCLGQKTFAIFFTKSFLFVRVAVLRCFA